MKIETPNPGTEAALKIGCRCPVLDNEHGQGYMGINNVFVVSADCPVHAYGEKNEKTKEA